MPVVLKEWSEDQSAVKVLSRLQNFLLVLALEPHLANDPTMLLVKPTELEGTVGTGFACIVLIAPEFGLEDLTGDDCFDEELFNVLYRLLVPVLDAHVVELLELTFG